jgi:hypothetical protein
MTRWTNLVNCFVCFYYTRICESPSLRRFHFSDALLTVKKNIGPTPLCSSHPLRPDFETKKDMIKGMLCEAPQNHSDAKKNVSVTLPDAAIFNMTLQLRLLPTITFGVSLLEDTMLILWQ